MKHGEKMLACIAAGVTLCTSASAITADHSIPYQGIVERNLFALKPPPAPPDPDANNKPQPSKITLTGITTILGNKRALMKTPPPPPKPGEQAKTEQSYILAPGERQDEIEVIEIDEVAGTVKVKNAGVMETVSFKENGVKQANAGAPPPAGGGTPGAAANPYAPAPVGANPGIPMPNRIPRLPVPGVAQVGNTPAGGSPFVGSAASSYGSTPAPSVRVGNTALPLGGVPAQTIPNPVPQAQLTLEEQIIHIEAQRQINRNNPDFPPLPPTELTPPELDTTAKVPTPPGF